MLPTPRPCEAPPSVSFPGAAPSSGPIPPQASQAELNKEACVCSVGGPSSLPLPGLATSLSGSPVYPLPGLIHQDPHISPSVNQMHLSPLPQPLPRQPLPPAPRNALPASARVSYSRISFLLQEATKVAGGPWSLADLLHHCSLHPQTPTHTYTPRHLPLPPWGQRERGQVSGWSRSHSRTCVRPPQIDGGLGGRPWDKVRAPCMCVCACS